MITSHDNQKLKEIRKLARSRKRTQLFIAEGEDLVASAAAHGWEPEYVLRADVDVEAKLLDGASTLGSGTRVIGVYRERWSEPGGNLSVWLDGIKDPGNIGTIMRSAHALCDGPVVIGPRCADPFGARAVRASMGSIFARPPARAAADALPGTRLALDRAAPRALRDCELHGPVVLMVGSEREGLGPDARKAAHVTARIPARDDAPDSLNAAMAATVALYELGHRISADG
ncbi:MAG: methyltransferase, TrmH family [Thermoleophilaceae bacterium]|jgi:TrmH family RNA methyltransferase|nr:methyltransferase, TrmH family [Thermoleophilaceae bacterium]